MNEATIERDPERLADRIASEAVAAILHDLGSRGTVRHCWRQMDDDAIEEIVAKWQATVKETVLKNLFP